MEILLSVLSCLLLTFCGFLIKSLNDSKRAHNHVRKEHALQTLFLKRILKKLGVEQIDLDELSADNVDVLTERRSLNARRRKTTDR